LDDRVKVRLSFHGSLTCTKPSLQRKKHWKFFSTERWVKSNFKKCALISLLCSDQGGVTITLHRGFPSGFQCVCNRAKRIYTVVTATLKFYKARKPHGGWPAASTARLDRRPMTNLLRKAVKENFLLENLVRCGGCQPPPSPASSKYSTERLLEFINTGMEDLITLLHRAVQ